LTLYRYIAYYCDMAKLRGGGANAPFREFRPMIARFIASALIAFCLAAPASAQTLIPLHIATTPTDTGAQVYYAMDLGLFKKAGFDVDVTSLNVGSTIAAGVAAGTFDIAQSAVSALALAHLKGVSSVIIAPGGAYSSKNPTSELIVAKDSPITKPADLVGKVVAVNALKSITSIAVDAWLDANGLKPDSVKFLELPFSEANIALQTGRIDAAFTAEPSLGAALQGGARIIGHPYDAISHDFLISAWYSTADYAKAHPDIVRKFAAIMAAAGTWANAHQAESALILEKYTKVENAGQMRRITYVAHLVPAQVQPLIDASAKYGVTDKTFPATDLFAPGIR
jgi:ABC-type nitrate/sulfonate/bicarbonate transport system substrate-binding protein